MLSAPMMAPPVMPVWLIRGLSSFLLGLGLDYAYPPFHRVPELDWVRRYLPDNKLTRWPQGYESQFFWFDDLPELRRSGPTIGWVNAAYRSSAQFTLNASWLRSIQVPVLAFVAGDERIVSPAATNYALPFIQQIDRHDFAGARHELLQELPEVTDKLWVYLLAFIEKNRVL
jgi:lysophospholipase